MELAEIIREFNRLEEKVRRKEDKCAHRVIKKYKSEFGTEDIEKFYASTDFIGTLFNLYFKIKGTYRGKELEDILTRKNFNINSSIHNAIYHLLGNEDDYIGIRVKPTKFFGVDGVNNDGIRYVLNTTKGKIEVYNATKIFRYDKAKDIFELPLPRLCYARTYDFIKMYPNDSKAVIMKMPNFFYDGHYHAYIEREDDIIDIAANAYYGSKEEASKILCGDIVGKYTFDEIDEFCKQFDKDSYEERSKIYIMTALNAIRKGGR